MTWVLHKTCEECVYGYGFGLGIVDIGGYCRRYPHHVRVFSHEHWCGEFVDSDSERGRHVMSVSGMKFKK